MICNKRELVYVLGDNNPLWLYNEIIKRNVKLSQSNFYNLLNNKSEWPLTVAYVIIDILKCELEQIFIIQE